MIDTLALSLPKEKITTLDLTHQGVDRWDLHSKTDAYEKYVKNPSARDKKSGLIFPRLTGFNRKDGARILPPVVKIEFSAPKILFKNNIDELIENQFPSLVTVLIERLERMGIRVGRQTIENATVTAVHFSKNFELTEGFTAQYVIGELGKINLNKRFDFARARFLNDGLSLYAHTSTHEFVLYDKIADLKKGSKRAIDKSQTPEQMLLFPELRDSREILRFEVRLNKKQKINAIFRQLGFVENPTFREVFNLEKSQAVLRLYWDQIIDRNSILLFAASLTPKDLLKQILLAKRNAKGKTAIYLTGLILLSREGGGLRELRSILAKRNKDRTWYRMVSELEETAALLKKLKPRAWYDDIQRQLNTYTPLRISTNEKSYQLASKEK